MILKFKNNRIKIVEVICHAN